MAGQRGSREAGSDGYQERRRWDRDLEDRCAMVRRRATGAARLYGLSACDAEDFASSQVLWLIEAKAPGVSDWTLRHRARDYAERLNRQKQTVVPLEEDWALVAASAEVLAMRSLFVGELNLILNRVSAPDREAFLRHHLDGASSDQISAETGRSAAAIRQAIHRVRRFVAGELLRLGWYETRVGGSPVGTALPKSRERSRTFSPD